MDASSLEKKVVLIFLGNENVNSGHGCLISRNGDIWLLTANHVVHVEKQRGAPAIYVQWLEDDGQLNRQRAQVIHSSEERDLALLQIVETISGSDDRKKWESNCIDLGSESSLGPGQEVYMSVSSDGNEFGYTIGRVSCVERKHSEYDNLTGKIKDMSCTTSLTQCQHLHGLPGSSGAPVFDSQGCVIGINSFGYGRMDNLIHLKEMKRFLTAFDGNEKSKKEKEKKRKPNKRGKGIRI